MCSSVSGLPNFLSWPRARRYIRWQRSKLFDSLVATANASGRHFTPVLSLGPRDSRKWASLSAPVCRRGTKTHASGAITQPVSDEAGFKPWTCLRGSTRNSPHETALQCDSDRSSQGAAADWFLFFFFWILSLTGEMLSTHSRKSSLGVTFTSLSKTQRPNLLYIIRLKVNKGQMTRGAFSRAQAP